MPRSLHCEAAQGAGSSVGMTTLRGCVEGGCGASPALRDGWRQDEDEVGFVGRVEAAKAAPRCRTPNLAGHEMKLIRAWSDENFDNEGLDRGGWIGAGWGGGWVAILRRGGWEG